MSFTKDQYLKCRYGNLTFGNLFLQEVDTIEIIPDIRQVYKEDKNYFATGVVDFPDKEVYEVITESGYRVECDAEQEFPILQDAGRDIYRRKIKTFKDVPLKKLNIGEALMIYQKPDNIKKARLSYGFERRNNDANNALAHLMSMIQIRPDRFLSSNDPNPMSEDNLHLVLDTVKEYGYFNVRDLNEFRSFGSAVSRFVNTMSMDRMTHLHWLGYKSHLGEIIYDLDWLRKYFEEDCQFVIYDIYNRSNFKYMQNCSQVTFKSIMNFFIKSCFFIKGRGKKSYYCLYHQSEELLREIQLRLLDYGVMSTIDETHPRLIGKYWKKTSIKSYWRFLVRKAGGKEACLFAGDKLKVLEINPAHLDKFIDMETGLRDETSYTRKARVISAYMRAKNLTLRDVYWDRIKSIKKLPNQTTYNVVHGNGRHIVVNGIVCRDWS